MVKDMASLIKRYNALLRIIVLGLVVAAVLLIVSVFSVGEQDPVKICFKNDACVDVFFIAKDDEMRAKGLTGHEKIEPMTAMLFIFPEEKKRTFWMKNMEFPIDIIFVSKSMRVVKIAKNAQPCEREPCEMFDSAYNALYVIEVPAGFADEYNLYQADMVEFVYPE